MIGFAMTGSFCTHARALEVIRTLVKNGEAVLPILSETVRRTDTRFGRATELIGSLTSLCGRAPVMTVAEAEPLGPKTPLEALIICPCTGNTAAKLARGITDTTVTMAAKAHLRADRPLLLAIASNDTLSGNFETLARLSEKKHVFLVPMVQDDPEKKPHSLVADFSLVPRALGAAREGKQIYPLFLSQG